MSVAVPERAAVWRHEATPRVLVLGGMKDGSGLPLDGLLHALAEHVDVRHVDASGARALLAARRAILRDGFEVVHLLDGRQRRIARMLRRLYRVRISIHAGAGPTPHRFDELFSYDAPSQPAGAAPLAVVPPAARRLPDPARHAVARVDRALRDVQPGRLVIALPYPEQQDRIRWYRDAVMPLLVGSPITLAFGAPRHAGRALSRGATASPLRVVSGRIDAEGVSAAARVADVIVVPPGLPASALPANLLLAAVTSGLPLVYAGRSQPAALVHERNSFIVEPDDGFALVQTINQLMAMPAQQRHMLGAEFAWWSLRHWHWDTTAEAMAERFWALAGRPRIPAQLRAA